MGNNPISMVDPLGLRYVPPYSGGANPVANPMQFTAAMFPTLGTFMSNSRQIGFGYGQPGGGLALTEGGMSILDMLAFTQLSGGHATFENGKPVNNNIQYSKTNEGAIEGRIPETVVVDKKSSFFGRLWNRVKGFFNSFEVEATSSYSIGLQAGLEVKTPLGNAGVDANAFSVELAGIRDDIGNGVVDKINWIGKDYWMKVKQGASIDVFVGGVSIEREMLSPVGGGAFFDKKVTKGYSILGMYREQESYQDGLFTISHKPASSNTEGFKFGFGIKFLLGAEWEIKIKRNR